MGEEPEVQQSPGWGPGMLLGHLLMSQGEVLCPRKSNEYMLWGVCLCPRDSARPHIWAPLVLRLIPEIGLREKCAGKSRSSSPRNHSEGGQTHTQRQRHLRIYALPARGLGSSEDAGGA